jgi:hypothetical protein
MEGKMLQPVRPIRDLQEFLETATDFHDTKQINLIGGCVKANVFVADLLLRAHDHLPEGGRTHFEYLLSRKAGFYNAVRYASETTNLRIRRLFDNYHAGL